MKTCLKCRANKNVSDFASYRSFHCKLCKKAKSASNKEYRRNYYKDYTQDSLKVRANWLRCSYNITITDYDRMFEEQQGCCAICRKPEHIHNMWGLKRLAVDHCKVTKRVRGLLCSTCNLGIGNLQHDVNLLKAAINHLEQ